jgi:hypothetical protein
MSKLIFVLIVLASLTSSVGLPKKALADDRYTRANEMISKAITLVQDGDLIVRDNQEFTSQLIKNFNRTDKSYSHAGIVIFENGYPFVYHILKGNDNPDERIRKDSLQQFCAPTKNYGFGIFRYNINKSEVNNLRTTLNKWYTHGVKFDSMLNLENDDEMYCSEMVMKLITKATSNRIRIGKTTPTKEEIQFFLSSLPVPPAVNGSTKVVAIDNLYLNPNCRTIERFIY